MPLLAAMSAQLAKSAQLRFVILAKLVLRFGFALAALIVVAPLSFALSLVLALAVRLSRRRPPWPEGSASRATTYSELPY